MYYCPLLSAIYSTVSRFTGKVNSSTEVHCVAENWCGHRYRPHLRYGTVQMYGTVLVEPYIIAERDELEIGNVPL